jgi:hypothetical protein
VRLLLLLLFCASAARAQEEPTPFWVAPPPPPPAKKKKPVQVEPLRMKQKKPPPRAEKKKPPPAPPPKAAEPPRPLEQVRTPEPTWIEPPPRPAPPVREPVAIEPAPAPPPAAAARIPEPVIPPPPRREPEPGIVEAPEPRGPRLTVDALAGLWGKSRSDGSGRLWDFAYGLRTGTFLFGDRLETGFEYVRAGSTAGSPFVNASSMHNLFLVRASWLLGPPRLGLLLGAGGGLVWAQTHYALQDVGGSPASIDANSIKFVTQITSSLRAIVLGGLEARAEVSVLLRDGALEVLPLFGLGAAF